MFSRIGLLTVSLFLLIGLSACGAMAFSPESAAQDAILRSPGSNFVVDANTLQVHQVQKIEDGTALAVMTYQGVRNGSQKNDCIAMYEIRKTPLGTWSSCERRR